MHVRHGADAAGHRTSEGEGPVGTTTLLLVLSAIVASTPRDEATVDRVDLVELNHCFDEYGRPAIDQLIFYDWCTTECRFQVRAWRLLKTPAQMPRPDVSGGYMIRWQDGAVLRQIYAKQFRETWTQYDPELTEREFLPKDKRRDLRKLAKSRWNEPPAIKVESPENAVASTTAPASSATVTTVPATTVTVATAPATAATLPVATGPAPASGDGPRPAALLSTTGATAP
jgi:hypothetical protein